MIKCFVFFIALLCSNGLHASCSQVPDHLRQTYATAMYHAFSLQCQGKSTLAICQFNIAYEEGKKCGESVIRLNAIQQLFIWYRTYGSCLNLFEKRPTGDDRIIGEYRPRVKMNLQVLPYQSEWGKNPQQAANIRNFMFGVAELISGVFCFSVGGPLAGPAGWYLVPSGISRIHGSLNQLWADHEALLALKQWEQGSLKAASNE